MSPDVLVTVPARPEHVPILRAVIAAVGARLDLTYDRIDDLRIAVDEACGQLLGLRPAMLTMRITPGEDRIEVRVGSGAAAAPVPWPPSEVERSLGWRILSALADSVAFELDGGGPVVRLEISVGAR